MDRFDDNNVLLDPLLPSDEKAVRDALNLGTAELGTTTNPMGNTLASVKERIMQGAGRLEFEFIGQGKGSSQSPTPESYGVHERQDMKELLTINDIKASVHASVHGNSLAGAGRDGFSGVAREQALKEINRAIHFAGDVTEGGAIVFHLHEWQRPLIHAGQDGLNRKENEWMFKGYDTEDKDSQMLVVDRRTGRYVSGIQKDQRVYEPEYVTGQDRPELVGKKDKNDRIIRKDDWLDVDGNVISKDAGVEELFDRVPKWDKEHTRFEIKELRWEDFVEKSKEWNKHHPTDLRTPEEMYAITKVQTQVLQAKGQSLFHGMRYDDYDKEYKKLKEAYDYYVQYEGTLPEEERWKLMETLPKHGLSSKYTMDERKMPSEILKEQMKSVKDSMRHIHESSSTADAQAKEFEQLIKNVQSAEKYGLEKSADTIATVGLNAMAMTKKKHLKNPLYAAPENYDQHFYGSHPDEMRKIIEESRKAMATKLQNQGYDKQESIKLASDHIKGTLDIGHMNMWRQHFNPTVKDPETGEFKQKYTNPTEREQAFEKWMLSQTEKLAKDGIIGHLHLTDNFGYDDEHLTPGQGNVPMKEFLKRMDKVGMKDMIVEPGSFNMHTSLPDTMALVNSPIYGGRTSMGPRMVQMQHRHFGYNAPPLFTAGPYVPSAEWQAWSQIPLE